MKLPLRPGSSRNEVVRHGGEDSALCGRVPVRGYLDVDMAVRLPMGKIANERGQLTSGCCPNSLINVLLGCK